MSAYIGRLIGGAGTGKTTELLRLMEANIRHPHEVDQFTYKGATSPLSIGFVSFTKAARREASTRAAETFGCKYRELEQDGWFRTLDSICYRVLGIGKELLAGDKESRAWMQEQLQEEYAEAGASEEGNLFNEADSDAVVALKLWDAARNRLTSLTAVHNDSAACNERTPSLDYVTSIASRYEQAKRLDGRCDFIDARGRFAGYRFDPLEGAYTASPAGDPPMLPVWFFDEQQDASALLDAVCRRLVERANRVYVVGDPFQAIYGFAGADSRYFLGWPVTKERIMPKSYRCPAPVLQLGESILRECSDYWDRNILPADHDGSVDHWLLDDIMPEIDPRQSWLLLARTNFHARRYAAALNSAGIPWTPVDGLGGWNAPKRMFACESLWLLENGEAITGDDWKATIDSVPSKVDGGAMLEHGVKARLAKAPKDETLYGLDTLPGATETLQTAIRSGQWESVIGEKLGFRAAVQRYGIETVAKPKVRIGTIHSVKGAEADNVVLSLATSQPCLRGQQTQAGWNEERRVWYVGATRARQRLVILKDEHRLMQRIA